MDKSLYGITQLNHKPLVK